MADGHRRCGTANLWQLSLGTRCFGSRPTGDQLQCGPFMNGNVVGLVALDDVLRFSFGGVVHIPRPQYIFYGLLSDYAAQPANLRIPSDMVANFELLVQDRLNSYPTWPAALWMRRITQPSRLASLLSLASNQLARTIA